MLELEGHSGPIGLGAGLLQPTEMQGIQMMNRMKALPAFIAALAAGLGTTALPAQAAVSSASIDGLTATLNLDGAGDIVTVSVAGGVLVHGQTGGGLASGSDWDSATPGDQTVPADGARTVIVTAASPSRSAAPHRYRRRHPLPERNGPSPTRRGGHARSNTTSPHPTTEKEPP